MDVPGETPRQAQAKKGKEAWPPGALVSKIFFACGNQVNANRLTACLLLLLGLRLLTFPTFSVQSESQCIHSIFPFLTHRSPAPGPRLSRLNSSYGTCHREQPLLLLLNDYPNQQW